MENKENNATRGKVFAIYLTDFIKGAKKLWWISLILAVLIGGYRFVDGYRSYVPVYTSSATFTIRTQNSSTSISGISAYSFYYDATTASNLTDTFPYILKSQILQEAICNDMGLSYLPASLSARSVSGSNLFTLSATGTDPKLTYDVLCSAIENYPDAAKYVVGNIQLESIESPEIALTPSNKQNYVSNCLEGAAIGIIIGVFFMLLYALVRRTVRTGEDVKQELNADLLGSIPKVTFKKYVKKEQRKLLFTNRHIDSAFLENYRVIRNIFTNAVPEHQVLMVTSTAPEEGKTTTAVNLALALNVVGKKVVLMDLDYRHPSVVNTLGLAQEDLISFSPLDDSFPGDVYECFSLPESNLQLILPKEGNEDLFADSGVLNRLFDYAREQYEYIMADTAPAGLVSDGMYIAQQVDGIVYVVRQDYVQASRVRSGIDALLSVDARIVGCILNCVETGNGLDGAAYGYGYGYGYGGYGYGYGYGYGRNKRGKSRKDKDKTAESAKEAGQEQDNDEAKTE